VKYEIATPFGLAMTVSDVKILKAFALITVNGFEVRR